jgi:hypothetical protein
VASRLQTLVASPDWGRYDTLVAEAMTAFKEDVVYAIQVVESARSISERKRKVKSRF